MAQSYQEIVSILEEAVSSDEIGAHRNFWRTLTRDEFVAFKVFGSIPLVVRSETGTGFDAAESNLIKALEARTPFGRDVGVAGANFRRMPAGRPALAQDQIDRIRAWLGAGAPE
ncbi:hypothetical protein U8C37_25435 (plasmid) [Sinorhizobium medicae]|uniref:hypothetical protein n=1 Tax=Sinorhizobium medicae TaxID=110321 RepID=UPI002AF6B246|nr:hypothetical protein [Sinorhizobium medicae]WQO88056.1 hypothetical protein U8C37_25435 [Sinorhizobium medicae]